MTKTHQAARDLLAHSIGQGVNDAVRALISRPQIGQTYIVRHGSKGTQLAQVVGFVRGNPDKVRIIKFLRNSQRWTQPMYASVAYLQRLADDRDMSSRIR